MAAHEPAWPHPWTSQPRETHDGSTIGFQPIEHLRAHEYVAEQIRRQISLKVIQDGESLPPDRELSERFRVGRATVQAAMRILEAERLVETRRGRHGGSFVTATVEDGLAMDYLMARMRRDDERIRSVLAFRGTVEPLAAELAATR